MPSVVFSIIEFDPIRRHYLDDDGTESESIARHRSPIHQETCDPDEASELLVSPIQRLHHERVMSGRRFHTTVAHTFRKSRNQLSKFD
jgi:hypothetical protein